MAGESGNQAGISEEPGSRPLGQAPEGQMPRTIGGCPRSAVGTLGRSWVAWTQSSICLVCPLVT